MTTVKLVVYITSDKFDESELSVVAYNAIEFGLEEGSYDLSGNYADVESEILFEEVESDYVEDQC